MEMTVGNVSDIDDRGIKYVNLHIDMRRASSEGDDEKVRVRREMLPPTNRVFHRLSRWKLRS
jgi:hypothetical protein